MQLDASIHNNVYTGETPAAAAVFAPAQRIDSESLSSAEVYGLTRGMVAGFVLEGAMALVVLGLWQLWHLAR